MPKLTSRQEKFTQLMASGNYSQSDAYRECYSCNNMKDATVNNNAYMLMKKSDIIARIKEIKEECRQHLKYDLEDHMKELDEIKELALTPSGQWGAINEATALKSVELKGKVMGLYTEKVDHTTNGQPINVIIGV